MYHASNADFNHVYSRCAKTAGYIHAKTFTNFWDVKDVKFL